MPTSNPDTFRKLFGIAPFTGDQHQMLDDMRSVEPLARDNFMIRFLNVPIDYGMFVWFDRHQRHRYSGNLRDSDDFLNGNCPCPMCKRLRKPVATWVLK